MHGFSAYQKVGIGYLNLIVLKFERNQLSASVIINLDQTPSKLPPGCNKNLVQKGNKGVLIPRSNTQLFYEHQIDFIQLRIFQIQALKDV